MKRTFVIILLLFAAAAARADYYNAQHWLIGSLEAGTAPSADNQIVYGYHPASCEDCAQDISGAFGRSGLPARYMINAFEIPGRVYEPGMPVSVEVRGTYRAGPAGIFGSAAGYDVMPLMTMGQLANLTIVALRESGINLRPGDYITDDPKLSLKMQDQAAGPLVARSRFELKDAVSGAVVCWAEEARLASEYRFSAPAPNGTYDLTATVWDSAGNSGTKTITGIIVSPDKRAIDIITDKPVWRPTRGEWLTLVYLLTRDMNVDIQGISISGDQFQPTHFTAGTMGGRAGYNQVTLEGIMAGGGQPGNGIYILQLSTDRGRTYLGKIKIVVAD